MKLPSPTSDEIIEIWKDIPGFEGRYQASSLGRIRSLCRYVRGKHGDRLVKERVLRQASTKLNYKYVSLGRGDTSFVHRLVATAFLDNGENKPCVNHINGKPSDNRLDNLEWCTYSENEKHSYRVLGKKPNKTGLGKHGLLNHDSKPILCITKEGKIEMFESSVFAAKLIQTEDSYIRKLCRKSKQEGRFIEVKGFKIKQITRQDFEYFKNNFLKAS